MVEMAKDRRNGSSEKSISLLLLTYKFWLGIIALVTLLFVVVDIQYHSYSWFTPPSIQNENPELSKHFLEKNARSLLEKVCETGVRTVGTEANEILAKDIILETIGNIQAQTNPIHSIEVDLQKPSSCFDLAFIGNFTTCYSNVKNILVRFSPKDHKPEGTLLISCHFDTAISSPGASDDMVSCAMMMEILRVLSQQEKTQQHAIVFIFNGAEETILQASHGFITQHKWTSDIKAFVNVEAAGSGGREMVFQTGPENPWLIAAYARSAPFPFASVIGQEIFQSGVIPSDTDFRIYRDFGKIPGIDIAYTYNGYIYHTKYDRPEYIPASSIQRAGENLLALMRELSDSSELLNPGDNRLGKMVFFDVLGYTMVYYPAKLGRIINSLVIILVCLDLYTKLRAFKREGHDRGLYVRLLAACWLLHAAGFVAVVCSVAILGMLITAVRPLMWYTNSWLVFPVYTLPAIAVWILVQQNGRAVFNSVFERVSVWKLESIFFEAAVLFWTLLLTMMTLCDIASAYICMILVVVPLVFRKITRIFDIKLFDQQLFYVTLTLLSLLPPFLHIFQLLHQLFIFFLPLMGRVGSSVKPDVVVAVFSAAPVLISSLYMAGFLHVSKNQTPLALRFLGMSTLFILIGCNSRLGFPYSANPKSPSAQRHVLHHYTTESYSFTGELESSRHGLLYLPFDYNGARYVAESVPEIAALQELPFDPDMAYSGLPYYFPMKQILSRVFHADMSKPKMEDFYVSYTKENLSPTRRKYNFVCRGEAIILNVYVSPREESRLVAWSFTPGTPIPSATPTHYTRPHYFVYTNSADSPHPDRVFSLEIEIDEGSDFQAETSYLDIGFGSHDTSLITPELGDLMNRFPNWTIPIGWAVKYKHYKL